MKVTVKSNVTFKKLKKANLEKMVFDNLIRPLGKEAKKKVDNSFKNNKDINGEPYEPLSYTYGRKKKELGKGVFNNQYEELQEIYNALDKFYKNWR